MASFFRVFSFMGQVLGMVAKNPRLLSPFLFNILLALPLHVIFLLVILFIPDQYAGIAEYGLMFVGCVALYFVDYFSAGLNTSLVADQVTTGNAAFGTALSRTFRASPSILVFAIVSAFFDLLEQIAHNNRGIVKDIILGILRTVWTTATYVMMPAMVLEGLGFVGSFKRSKDLMMNDPTQVGVGVVGLGLVTWLISVAAFAGANYFAFGIVARYSVPAGLALGLLIINVSWALSAYLKSTYYTCFYLWARECERHQQASPALAPEPLRNVLGGAQAQANPWG